MAGSARRNWGARGFCLFLTGLNNPTNGHCYRMIAGEAEKLANWIKEKKSDVDA